MFELVVVGCVDCVVDLNVVDKALVGCVVWGTVAVVDDCIVVTVVVVCVDGVSVFVAVCVVDGIVVVVV